MAEQYRAGGKVYMRPLRTPAFVPPPRPAAAKFHEGPWYLQILKGVLRELWWIVVGRPKPKLRGKWVYNAKDGTWRYYESDWD